MRGRLRFLDNDNGSTVAEFALVLSVAIVFIFGLLNISLVMYTTTRMHWAAEDAARCASVRTACADANAAQKATKVTNWAASHYQGTSSSAVVWRYSPTGTCSGSAASNTGHTVTGQTTYNLRAGVFYKSFQLYTTACYP